MNCCRVALLVFQYCCLQAAVQHLSAHSPPWVHQGMGSCNSFSTGNTLKTIGQPHTSSTLVISCRRLKADTAGTAQQQLLWESVQKAAHWRAYI